MSGQRIFQETVGNLQTFRRTHPLAGSCHQDDFANRGRGMKPSQPEDLGAGSNAQAQPDALGKTQQQDQQNPFAAPSGSSSPDAGPPGTKPRLGLASLMLGITSGCILFFAYEQGWNRTLPPYIVIFVLCGVVVISISAVVCGGMEMKRVKRSDSISLFFVAAVAGVFMGGIQLVYTIPILALSAFLMLAGLM